MIVKENSQQKILQALSTPKSICELKIVTKIPGRTLRYNLSKLKNQNLIKEIAMFSDMRKKLFVGNGDEKNGIET